MSNLEGLKILIVDDDPFMRRTIRAVLRAIDRFVVEEAADGDIALELIGVFKPDVALCDVVMPGTGGLEFVAQLRKHPEAALRLTPVIMLTGRADEATVRDAARLQIRGFVIKPISPKLLAGHLQTIFASRQAVPAA